MASKHNRKGSTRALPRRTTKGPLDGEDSVPLYVSSAPTLGSGGASPLPDSKPGPLEFFPPSGAMENPEKAGGYTGLLPLSEKDVSFLLEPSIYHNLSQLNVPVAFRKPFPPTPTSKVPSNILIAQIQTFLTLGDFLSAAHLAAAVLTSGAINPCDFTTVFELLGIRYSCLELTGNSIIAAQESKALEDLTSAFYYVEKVETSGNENDGDHHSSPPPQHIMPFYLRLQTLRLQSIGFSDPRRGIAALYELGSECREHLAALNRPDEQDIWKARLDEVGIRVVNALIEIGDLECAARTLDSLQTTHQKKTDAWLSRATLLRLKIGDLFGAKNLLGDTKALGGFSNSLGAHLAIAEGRYEDAATIWETMLDVANNEEMGALMKQNLAVVYLYTGHIAKSRTLMEELLNQGHSFSSLTVNLATLYELCSDSNSANLKVAVSTKLAKQEGSIERMWSKTNADFKL